MRNKQSSDQYAKWAANNPDKVAAKRERRYQKIRIKREFIRDEMIANILSRGFTRIYGFPDYFINPNGDIYSSHNRKVIKISPGTKPGGYKFVGLRNGKSVKYKMVHRLVAETYIPNPMGYSFVNHIDGNKNNNSALNLEWCTAKENSNHAVKLGLHKSGTKSARSKLNEDQVIGIYKMNGRYRDIAHIFGVSAQTVCNIKSFKTYKDIFDRQAHKDV